MVVKRASEKREGPPRAAALMTLECNAGRGMEIKIEIKFFTFMTRSGRVRELKWKNYLRRHFVQRENFTELFSDLNFISSSSL